MRSPFAHVFPPPNEMCVCVELPNKDPALT